MSYDIQALLVEDNIRCFPVQKFQAQACTQVQQPNFSEPTWTTSTHEVILSPRPEQ
jgi:hypothetical protein